MTRAVLIQYSEKHAYSAEQIRAQEATQGHGVVFYQSFGICYLMCSPGIVEYLSPVLGGFERISDFEALAHFQSRSVTDKELKTRIQALGAPIETHKWEPVALIAIAVPKE